MNLLLKRTMTDAMTMNTVVADFLIVRFQIAPGDGPDLGIANAEYSILVGEKKIVTGKKTDATGAVLVPRLLLAPPPAEPVIIEIFETRYALHLHHGLEPASKFAGVQKRLDVLGYVTGYQLVPIGSAKPDDGIDGPRTQQAIMNFQTDHGLAIDGDLGSQTIGALKRALGEK